MNLIGAIALCGAMLGALLATALRLVKGRNRIANDILALFSLIFAVHLLLLVPLMNQQSFNFRVYPLFLTDVIDIGTSESTTSAELACLAEDEGFSVLEESGVDRHRKFQSVGVRLSAR